ncbi:MAG: sensor histidine kinase [Rubripirellula sp.]|jgi:signal transduction histidine kinase
MDNLQLGSGKERMVVREGNYVLKRTSIRTKLAITLTLLSVVFGLLVSAVVFAVESYNSLALQLTQHSREVQRASELHITAYKLIGSFGSKLGSAKSAQEHGLLPSKFSELPSGLLIELGWDFESCGADFETHLDTCCGLSKSQSTNLLMPELERGDRLAEIKNQFHAFKQLEPFSSEVKYSSGYNPEKKAQIEKFLRSLLGKSETYAEETRDAFTAYSDQLRRQARFWRNVACGCAVATVALVVTFFCLFTSYIAKPFRTLIDGSRLVAGGEFDHRIDLGTEDELNELAQAMNSMTNRFQHTLGKLNATCEGLDREVKARTREVIQNEQLASVGFLAAGVAHEINNPLATIAMSSEVLQTRLSDLAMLPAEQRVFDSELQHELPKNLRRIEDEAYRCKGITEKLLDFSRLSEVQRAPTNIVDVVNEVVDMVGQLGEFRCKTLTTHASHAVVVEVNPQEIRQVILNLVTNALESVDADGAVDIYVDLQNGAASVVVEDTGCGMDIETQQHLFEPFFTRRRDGTGTGLGLSISYRIVSKHGGSLKANSEGPGRGSRMLLTLPCVASDEKNQTGSPVVIGLKNESYQAAG